MPRYEYKCSECERELEIEHSIKDDAVEHQKHIRFGGQGEPCNGKLNRLISAVSHTWKGGAPTPKFH
jgi:predicted nucleic acid-binding Zn ribbon protein